MRRANIGDRFWNVTLGQIPDKLPHKRYVERYIETFEQNIREGVGLLFYGETERGKTSCAVIVQKAAILAGCSTLFIEADSLQELIIEKRPYDADETWIERARRVDLLVLDDLGIEHAKEWSKSVIESLVRRRSNRRKATIITMNLGTADLETEYGKPFRSVVSESIYPVPVKGKEWRADARSALAARFEGRESA